MNINDIKVGEKYRHFKGNIYEIIALAKNCNDLSAVVVYKDIQNNMVWTRDGKEFCETVTRNGKTIKRFEKMKTGE